MFNRRFIIYLILMIFGILIVSGLLQRNPVKEYWQGIAVFVCFYLVFGVIQMIFLHIVNRK